MATFNEVKQAASGRWSGIINALCGSHLNEAVQRYGDPVDCPVCGGKKKFRVFDKPGRGFEETGGVICNSCGSFADGLSTIAWLRGDPGYDRCVKARNDVADLLRMNDVRPLSYQRRPSTNGKPKSRGSPSHTQAASPPQACSSLAASEAEEKPEYQIATNANSMWSAWRQTVDLLHPSAAPARRYLSGRMLRLSKDLPHELSLRFHPSLDYYEKDKDSGELVYRGSHPTMMALLLRPDGTPACLHRTYLTPGGAKAEVPEPKKLWNCFTDEPLGGSAIRLYPSSKVLGFAEGIETALAARLATRMPVWATYTAMILPHVVVPPHVEFVVIWADRDRSGAGLKKASELQKRLRDEGRRCEIALPQRTIPHGKKSVDWADIWLDQDESAFPYRDLVLDAEIAVQPQPEVVNGTR